MTSTSKPDDYDATERVSRRRQWQEKSMGPLAQRTMSKDDILYFQTVLAQSYNCEQADISYRFEKIRDENDADRDDCLNLMYFLKGLKAGVEHHRCVYTLKIPIPEELKLRAEQLRREQRGRRRPPARALMDAGQTYTGPNPSSGYPSVQTPNGDSGQTGCTATIVSIAEVGPVSETNVPTPGEATLAPLAAGEPARKARPRPVRPQARKNA